MTTLSVAETENDPQKNAQALEKLLSLTHPTKSLGMQALALRP